MSQLRTLAIASASPMGRFCLCLIVTRQRTHNTSACRLLLPGRRDLAAFDTRSITIIQLYSAGLVSHALLPRVCPLDCIEASMRPPGL